MTTMRDALGREVSLEAVPQRVVSLLPSETENVVQLAGPERLVGRTDYCPEPDGRSVPSVGGTKKFHVDAVVELAPDLVLANQEENGRRDVERLIEAGITVYVGFPQTVDGALDHLDALARLLGAGESLAQEVRLAVRSSQPVTTPRRVFVPIWREPFMTFDHRTYASDVLRQAGGDNVFADRPRRFPLAADVGTAPSVSRPDADTRYPRTSLAEVIARAPDVVLLPDEPYAFQPEHADALRAGGVQAECCFVSGKDLFWPGVRTGEAIQRLRRLLQPEA
ncbi:MAG: helical backbone metal receptor [Sandaracinaceae bacterium]